VLTAPRPGARVEQLAGPEQAMAWFEAEHQILLATIRHAAESGFNRHAWQLSWSMATFLTVHAHWDDLTATQRTALAAATSLDDHVGQALAHDKLGFSCLLCGHHDQALARCQQALALQRRLGDRLDEAGTWDSIGYIHHQLGQHAQAARCYQQALRLLAQTKERHRTAIILDHLGDTRHATGDVQA